MMCDGCGAPWSGRIEDSNIIAVVKSDRPDIHIDFTPGAINYLCPEESIEILRF